MVEEPLILVVGSINMDLVVRAPRLPGPGETLQGDEFRTSPGGKGANQAMAIARLGGRCALIGAVGSDTFGPTLRKKLAKEAVDIQGVTVVPQASTGVAVIVVDSTTGENSIVLSGGANNHVTPDDHLMAHAALFEQAAVLLLQLELPLQTVRAAMEMARRHHCKIVLDPAPAPRHMPAELCQVDVLTPNICEAELITGQRAGLKERIDKAIASDLIARGAQAAVLKLGARGTMVVTADGRFRSFPAHNVNVVDTTGAGDAFTGALALGIARGQALKDAARFANAAGALACTKIGAQDAMPTADEVRVLMDDQPQ
jgi:ribokinase